MSRDRDVRAMIFELRREGSVSWPESMELLRMLDSLLTDFPCGWPEPIVCDGEVCWNLGITARSAVEPGMQAVIRMNPDEARGIAARLIELAKEAEGN